MRECGVSGAGHSEAVGVIETLRRARGAAIDCRQCPSLRSHGTRILGAVSARITTDDVVHVARLSRLDLTDDELVTMTAQLADVLAHFADIDELALGDVEPMTQPFALTNVMRDDVVTPSLDRDEVLAAAPETADGRFKVPPIVGLAG